MKIKLSVDKVFKLTSDYEDVFINNIANTKAHFEEVMLSNKTINKIHYDDVFAFEPQTYYYIQFDKDITIDVKWINSSLLHSGLMFQYDDSNNRLFVYNCNDNIVYIKKGAVIIDEVL